MRKGDYIETYTGKMFWPIDPRPEEIDIRDIAHSLSRQCRFTGHTKTFYSIAQHCINVSSLLKSDGYNTNYQLFGLLHDASEAYLTDVARPVKPYLTNYKEIEKVIQDMIYDKYRVFIENEDVIKQYDDICLHIEGYNLMPNKTGWAKEVWRRIDLSYKDMTQVELDYLKLFYEL
jgi:hypothetical protein